MRRDEIDWFERISDGKTALWLSGATTYLYHATVDGLVAVCSSAIPVDRDRDEYKNTGDRSCNTMTCDRCADLVRRIPMKHPDWRQHEAYEEKTKNMLAERKLRRILNGR